MDSGLRSAGLSLTAVAIDKDKNSLHAVKWAADHLINSPEIILIHVRSKSSQTEVGPETTRDQADAELSQLFLPYRGFGARKGIRLKEVVLEGADISKAIVNYINSNCIQNIAVGASNRSIMKKLRHFDVPTSLIKSAPDFCAVYVLSKGKPTASRSAKAAAPASVIPPRQLSAAPSTVYLSDPEDSVRSSYSKIVWRHPASSTPSTGGMERRSTDMIHDHRKAPASNRPLSIARSAPKDLFMESLDRSSQPQRSADYGSSFSDDSDLQRLSFQSMDYGESIDLSSVSMDSPRSITSPLTGASRGREAEVRHLKLELKQAMDMYGSACKEVVTAKRVASEFEKWRIEEKQKLMEIRHAEEEALAAAEAEKAKCKAAVEAAEASHRIAELEAQKRRLAERKARRELEEKKRALDALDQTDTRYRKYTIEEIEAATNSFAAENKIGEGSYGPVFKAFLDHTPVAIKVLRPDAAQGRKQFQQEIEVLSCIRHPNMVLLLGACPEYGCLVYEFMDNGSLDDRLFRKGNTPPIPWSVRFKIAAEIATALLFLHQTKPEPLVHRDLKPANILLDRNYVTKISDVGLARLVPPSVADSVTQYHMTSAAGTFCYIDPEYQQTGMLGVKSDVYSLGIMLLQIITARPPMGLTHHVERAIEKGAFAEVLDPAITDWPVDDALSYAQIALKCAELRRKDRPDLGTVVLPELNRLRNHGHEYEGSQQYGGGGNNRGGGSFSAPPRPWPYSGNHSQPRVRSHGHQKVVFNPSVAARWTSSSDGK
ncbi:U-box domain-containing protein 52 [Platanthera guangdongensis]|uniref:RING-type E3 ubiquitin transferase n=1 Tax=Platanthera guangdongensis TaxID=2320717 RepID=A0ABR2M1Q4_9ASPA